jgi:5'(3')-deoxyribonucleotidase
VSIQNLIIYNFSSLYHILEEVGLDLNLNVISADNENSLNEQVSNFNNYLVISNKKHLDINSFVFKSTI